MSTNTYDGLIAVACNRYGVPFALAKAIMLAESGGDPRAWRIEVKTAKIDGKPDGSRGLFQMLGNTARGLGFKGDVGNDATHVGGLYDPATAIEYGVKFLRDLLKQTGNVEDAISAYNGGVRPSLGYGKKAAAAVRVCNARDAQGNCIAYRDVKVGEYGNQPYVNRVAALMRQVQKEATPVVPASPKVTTASIGTLASIDQAFADVTGFDPFKTVPGSTPDAASALTNARVVLLIAGLVAAVILYGRYH